MENDREMNHKSVCRFALYDDAYVLVGHTSAPQDLGQDHDVVIHRVACRNGPYVTTPI